MVGSLLSLVLVSLKIFYQIVFTTLTTLAFKKYSFFFNFVLFCCFLLFCLLISFIIILVKFLVIFEFNFFVSFKAAGFNDYDTNFFQNFSRFFQL